MFAKVGDTDLIVWFDDTDKDFKLTRMSDSDNILGSVPVNKYDDKVEKGCG